MGVILCVFFSGCLRIAVVGTRVRDSGSAAPGGVSGMGGGAFGPLPAPRAPSWGLREAEQRGPLRGSRARLGGLSPLMTAL